MYGNLSPQYLIYKLGEMIAFGCGSILDIKSLPVYEKDLYWKILIEIETAKRESETPDKSNQVPYTLR